MSRLPRIGTILDDKLNGVSMWRTIRPWTDLHKMGVVEFDPMYKVFNEHEPFRFDVLYVAHAHSDQHIKMIEAANLAGCLVWVDLDDDLADIPIHNQKHATIQAASEKAKTIIKMAQIFSVTTPELADKYASIAKVDPIVLPNSIHEAEIKKTWNNNTRALWRSNYTQLRDMWVNRKDYDTMVKGGLQFAFIGAPPPWIDDPKWTEWGPSLSYFNVLRKTEASYFWKPLENIPFNHCKSNIALLEGAMAGALTVSNLKNDKWRPAISADEAVNRNQSWKERRYDDMVEFILEGYNSAKVNTLRYEHLIKHLI